MLRLTVLSLLLGAAASIAALALVFAPAGGGPAVQPVTWDGQTMKLVAGNGEVRGSAMHLDLRERTIAQVDLPIAPTASADYPYLYIALDDHPRKLRTYLLWTKQSTGDEETVYLLERDPARSVLVATHEIRRFAGEITSLSLIFHAPQGGTVTVREISLQPLSLGRQLRSIWDDWRGFEEWRRAAINSYSGVTRVSPFYPAPLVATLLLFSLGAYALLAAARRRRPDWRIAGLLFLTCWWLLDLPWQYKLLRQVAETQHQFAGLTSEEKLAAGADRFLYRLAMGTNAALEGDNPRVFVASSDEYTSLRTAYYLYPTNVFWKLDGDEIPHHGFLRKGDYILMVPPSNLRYRPVNDRLITELGWFFDIEQVFEDAYGILLRIK